MKTKLYTTVLGLSLISNVAQAGKIYTYESDGYGFNTKSFFYDSGKEVIGFDSQFTAFKSASGKGYAQEALEFLKAKSSNPMSYMIVTHPNPDKFNGLKAFKDQGALAIMSQASADNMENVHNYKKYYFTEMAKMFTDKTYPELESADITFEKKMTIRLDGDVKVELHELGKSGVATNQTVAYIPQEKALFVGDLIHHEAHAWLEGPLFDQKPELSIKNWIETLKSLEQKFPAETKVYGGRGNVATLKVAVKQQIDYLKRAEKITRSYLESLKGQTLEEKKQSVNYKELAKIFEAEFPGYELSYMIEYGAYGLIMAL